MRAVWLWVLGVVLCGCGARTGPSEEPPCEEGALGVFEARAEVVFVIDRSNSMAAGFLDPSSPNVVSTRWERLQSVFRDTLQNRAFDVGAKFFPDAPSLLDPSEACDVTSELDVVPAFDGAAALNLGFDASRPAGGTPTAQALLAVGDYFGSHEHFGPRHVVLVTDGGPNCARPRPDPGACICTGPVDTCDPLQRGGPDNCLDEGGAVAAIEQMVEIHHAPVHVIGINGDSRPELLDVMDRMAIAGSRPRQLASERRFYNVVNASELESAFESITGSVERCTLRLEPFSVRYAELRVTVDGAQVPRDETGRSGFRLTSRTRYEIELPAQICGQLAPTARIEVEAICPAGRGQN